MKYESFIAIRHLKSRRRSFLSTITLIAIIGVFLGVMALTSVVSVTGGFEEAIRERVLGINSHLLVIKYGIDFRDYREVQKQVEEIPGVIATTPFVLHEMIASHASNTSGILIKGVEPSTLKNVSDLPKFMTDPASIERLTFDRFPPDGKKKIPKAIIGRTLADQMKLEVGDKMTVTSPLESLDPDRWNRDGHIPSFNAFEITGIFTSGFHEYDSRLVMVDYHALQDFFNQGDMVTGVDVRVEDVFRVAETARKVKDVVPPGRFRILDWRELNHNLFTSLGLQRLVLAVLFCFIVLVACFNIVCTLIMIVLDKQKEIAILKSMGANNISIMKVFVMEGLMISTVGTISGVIGGLIVCQIIRNTDLGLDPTIYMIDYLPVRVVPLEIAAVCVAAIVISLFATIGPAWWASKWNPVDGLRYD